MLLYVIIPYFNYANFRRREELFERFVNRLCLISNIKIVVSEAVLRSAPSITRSSLTDRGITHHVVFTDDVMWHKENLVNIAASRLPHDWAYMAWIDSDITFTNPNWVDETISSLQTNQVVQMFSSVVELGPEREVMSTCLGFAFIMKRVGSYDKTMYRHGKMHPGFCWAMTRGFYEEIGGLPQWAILGDTDHHIAMSIVQGTTGSVPDDIHDEYKNALREFSGHFKGVSWGYVPGAIFHEWHGKPRNRLYSERWNILRNNDYVPSRDLTCNEDGLLQFTEVGKRLCLHFKGYFEHRQEDDMIADDPPQIQAILQSHVSAIKFCQQL